MKFFLLIPFLIYSVAWAGDLQIESVTIKDSGQPEEFDMHSGDYIVEVKLRNTSEKAIQVEWYSVSNYYRVGKLSDPEGKLKYGSDFHKYNSLCCHAPVYETIEANEFYTVRFRDSSKNEGKEMFLKMRGKEGEIELGKYLLKLTEDGEE
ncbi:MAG: hypothetical protein ACSHX6_01805 [Akkermansiaceae bacterium]